MKRIRIAALVIMGLALLLLSGCGATDTKQAAATPEQPKAAAPAAENVPTAVPKGIPVLMYHKVGPDKDNDAVIREDLFRAQMKFLHDNGFHPITLAQLNDYVRNGKPVITDGPFAETKEQLGGYYLLDCANLDEALAWAGRCPAASLGTIEVRPVTA